MEENEENVFEIEDYTTQGDIEKFISQIEDTIFQWKINAIQRHSQLEKSELSNCEWEVNKTELQYSPKMKLEFLFHHAKLNDEKEFTLAEEDLGEKIIIPVGMEDLVCRNNDFMPRGHHLAIWYGLRNFIVVKSPVNIDNEDLMITLLSTIQCALFNSSCEVPIFLEIKEKHRMMYNGRLIGSGCMTEFQVVHLKRSMYHKHNEVSNLSSLLHIFKSKIRTPIDLPVQLAIRLSYILPTLMPKNKTNPMGSFCGLPWGSMLPPIDKVYIYTTWPILTEDLVEDTLDYTDLDPLQAPQWSVKLGYTTESKTGLSRALKKMLKMWNMARQQHYYLNRIPSFEYEQPAHTAFNPIAQSEAEKRFAAFTENLSLLPDGAPQASGAFGVMKEEIENVIESIFSESDFEPTENRNDIESYLGNEMKSAPYCSILRSLVIGLLHQLSSADNIELRFTYMWAKFVQKLRKYYDTAKDISSLTSPQPQLQYSLFQQKIEMVQYCIRQKQIREKTNLEQAVEHEDLDDTEEEFFDAEGDSADTIEYGSDETKKNVGIDRASSLCLLKYDKTRINIPILQHNPPMTEDLLMKQEEMMTSLGTSEEGKKERMKMQCKMLEYDMMAFKAANYGSKFEDFVRWHSPSDWSKTEGLSARMTLPGNIWVELWENSPSVPASRQQRLFDDTSAAQSILRDFENYNLGQITELILPILIHESLRSAIRNVGDDESVNQDLLKMIPVKFGIESCRNGFSYSTVDQIIDIIAQIENFDSRRKWLRTRFAERGESKEITANFNKTALTKAESILEGASRGPIAKLLTDDIQLRFPSREESKPYSLYGLNATCREYILRSRVGRPTCRSTVLPQRLYALVDDNQFRMAGAFSMDTTFII